MCNEFKYIFLKDTNSCVAKLRDYVPSDDYIFSTGNEIQNDLDKFRIREGKSIPLSRNSSDNRTNAHGVRLIKIEYTFKRHRRAYKKKTKAAFY